MKKAKGQKKESDSWKTVKIALSKKTTQEMLGVIKELYDLSDANRNFLSARFVANMASIDTYKRLITEAICPDFYNDRNAEISFAVARKAISDFRKACSDPVAVIELMVHYVEIGTKQARSICIDYESYYSSLESMFSKVIGEITGKHKTLAPQFLPRLQAIAKKAVDSYGHQDMLRDHLDEAFSTACE